MKIYQGKTFEVVFCEWNQEFPGYTIVSCNKECLSDLSDSDWIELGRIEKELERVMKKVFDATMFNFVCLMNDAYRDGNTPHVHWHLSPRYKGERVILGKKYNDVHFGQNFRKYLLDPEKRQKDIFTEDEKNKMLQMVQNEFNLKD